MPYLYNNKKQMKKKNHWFENTSYEFIEKYQLKQTELRLSTKDLGIKVIKNLKIALN